MTACQASFSNSSIDSGLLVAEGGYELTAAKCVQCICTDAPQYVAELSFSLLTLISLRTWYIVCIFLGCGLITVNLFDKKIIEVDLHLYIQFNVCAIAQFVILVVMLANVDE